MAAAAEVSGFALLFIAAVMPVACRVQFTSKYGGRDVVALLGSSANFTWNFTGEMRVVDWGTKSPTSDDIETKLVEIRRSGSGSASPSLQYAGRVNGSWDGKTSPGQVIITLNLIRKEDERFYSCQILPVDILDQKDDDTFKLVVKDPAKASLAQSVIPAEVGTTARLQCNFTGIPTPNIAWIRQNQPNDIMVIMNSSKYELTSTSATISELAVKDVTLEDHGYYVCNASGFGYDVAQGFVGVPFFETVIPSGRVITIESPIGAPYLLECPVRGFPPPEVTWTLPNGTTLPNRLTKTLSIDAALGNYTCSATSLDEEVSEHIFVIKEDVITVVFTIERGPPVVVSWNNVSGAAYYTLKLTGDDIKNDSFLGRAKGGKESREIPINSLQFEDGKKKEQVNIDVQVLAVDANYRLIAKGGPRIATVSGVRTLHATGVPLSVALVFILTF